MSRKLIFWTGAAFGVVMFPTLIAVGDLAWNYQWKGDV
jgi:hypothetical protein